MQNRILLKRTAIDGLSQFKYFPLVSFLLQNMAVYKLKTHIQKQKRRYEEPIKLSEGF